MKKLIKRVACFVLSLAMVFTMSSTSAWADTNENGSATTCRLYIELPEGTQASQWAANVWGGASVIGSGIYFRPESWGDGDWYPTLLTDESLSGWGYVEVSGNVKGMQFLKEDGFNYNCWNPEISEAGISSAFFEPATGRWYKDASKENEVLYNFGLVGMTELAGYFWDTNHPLTFTQSAENGSIYSLTVPNLAAGEYKYKVMKSSEKKGWDSPWTEDDKVFNVSEPSNVTFTINVTDSTKNVSEVIKPVSEDTDLAEITIADRVKLSVDDALVDMDLFPGGVFEKKVMLSSGTHAVSVTVNGTVYAEKTVNVDSDGEVWFKLKDNVLTDSVNDGILKSHVTLAGDFGGILLDGIALSEWAPTDTNGDLEYIGGGFYKRTFNFDSLEENEHVEYKVVYDQDWNQALGDKNNDNNNFSLDIPKGATKLTILVDTGNGDVYDNYTMHSFDIKQNTGVVSKKSLDTVVSLTGTMNNWEVSVGQGFDFEQITDKLYRFYYNFDKGSCSYKVRFNANEWYEKEGNRSFMAVNDQTRVMFIYDAGTDSLYDSIHDSDTLADMFGVARAPYVEPIPKIPGTFPGPEWDPTSNAMTGIGNGIYSHTFENVPAGTYEYKIAYDSWDKDCNFGVDGVPDGANYVVVVPEEMDVTVLYSSSSNRSVTSVGYTMEEVKVSVPGIGDIALTDYGLTGIYSGKMNVPGGNFYDISVTVGGEEVESFNVNFSTAREITFYYDDMLKMCFVDEDRWNADSSKIKYDSKDTYYKNKFGAVATDEEVTFTIDTDDKVDAVTMIAYGSSTKSVPFTKNAGENGKTSWSGTTSFESLGQWGYFFVVSAGGALRVYSDDGRRDYGEGVVTEYPSYIRYDLTVYDKSYKTPDWMKDAVIYQIFPDRFANGDETNDENQITSRGNTNYEFPDWNLIPENPEQEASLSKEEYEATGAFYGDRNWSNEIYGGDFEGIVENIDYLKALGVTVIYLNPVFHSISSHRYDATDYSKIDPILGDLGDFERLVEVAEENGMKIVLDGVFNHVSDDSIYFDRYYKFVGKDGKVGAYPYWAYVYDCMNEEGYAQDDAEDAARAYFAEKNVTDFSYTTWFAVYNSQLLGGDQQPVRDTIGDRSGKPVYGYEGWWGYDSMPVIKSTNGSEYQTEDWAKKIIGTADDTGNYENNGSIAQYWLSQGSNGWRLDVADEVSAETWRHFRESVKAMDSDAVIIGEIWNDATHYLYGDMYDSVMNYVFRNAVMNYAKGGKASDSMATLERIRERYPAESFYAMMNLVDSHDTSRVLSYLDGIDDDRNDKAKDKAFPHFETTSELAKKRQHLTAFLQFTYAGAPTIYYGDEVGVVGADDPDDRRTINWGYGSEELVKYYAKLSAVRHSYSALRTGSVEPLKFDDERILGYVRGDENDRLIVLANNSEDEVSVSVNVAKLGLDATKPLTDLISGATYEAADTIEVSISGISGVILTTNAKEITIDEKKLRVAYDPNPVEEPEEEEKEEQEEKQEEQPKEEQPKEEQKQTSGTSSSTPAPSVPANRTEFVGMAAPAPTVTQEKTPEPAVAEEVKAVEKEEKKEEAVVIPEDETSLSDGDENADSKELTAISDNGAPLSNNEEKKPVTLWIVLGSILLVAVAAFGVYNFKVKKKED